MFEEVDDIVRLGKLIYNQIPEGKRCKGCPILNRTGPAGPWVCDLRPVYGLIFDGEGPFKSDNCPKSDKRRKT